MYGMVLIVSSGIQCKTEENIVLRVSEWNNFIKYSLTLIDLSISYPQIFLYLIRVKKYYSIIFAYNFKTSICLIIMIKLPYKFFSLSVQPIIMSFENKI